MVPNHLSGTYDQYKLDTKTFATWLYYHATASGYSTNNKRNNPPPSSGRLKGKAKIEARKAQGRAPGPTPSPASQSNPIRKLPTREIISQAEIITGKLPKIVVPIVVQRILRRAIQARKRFAVWYKEEGKSTQEALESHDHFISVLEKVFELLGSHFEPPSSKSNSGKPSTGSCPSQTSAHFSGNRFNVLDVEDPLDEDEIDVSANIVPQTAEAVEFDLPVTDDLSFIVFCFFEDLHKYQNLINQTWKFVANGECNYISASLMTNIIIQLVDCGEKNILALAPELFGENECPYSALSGIMLDHILQGASLCSKSEVSKGVETFYFSTFWLMKKYASGNLKIGQIHPVRASYPGSEGVDIIAEWGGEEFDDEDRALSQLLLDMDDENFTLPEMLDGLEFDDSESKWRYEAAFPLEDEITKSLRSFLISKKFGVLAVFAARIFLDIRKQLGNATSISYKDLLRKGATIEKSIGIEWDGDKWSDEETVATPVGTMVKSWRKFQLGEAATQLSYSVRHGLKLNKFVRMKQHIASIPKTSKPSRSRRLNQNLSSISATKRIETITQSPDPEYRFKNTPLYSGIQSLRFALRAEDVGVQLANIFTDLFTMAHLYNAAVQMDLLPQKWAAMDDAISVHGNLFFDKLPTTGSQIRQHFCIKAGYPASMMAKGRRTEELTSHEMTILRKQEKEIFKVSKASKALSDYIAGGSSPESVMQAIHVIKHGTSASRVQLTQLQMLTQIRDFTADILPRIELDYVLLVRKCRKVFVLIDKRFKEQFGIEYMIDGVEISEGDLKRNFTAVYNILLDEFARRENGSKGKALGVAAEVIHKFIVDDREEEIEPFDVVAETAVEEKLH